MNRWAMLAAGGLLLGSAAVISAARVVEADEGAPARLTLRIAAGEGGQVSVAQVEGGAPGQAVLLSDLVAGGEGGRASVVVLAGQGGGAAVSLGELTGAPSGGEAAPTGGRRAWNAGYGRLHALRLLHDEEVGEAIELTAEQKAVVDELENQLHDVYEAAHAKIRATMGLDEGWQDLTPEERSQRAREGGRQRLAAWEEAAKAAEQLEQTANETLTEAQRTRLQEIAPEVRRLQGEQTLLSRGGAQALTTQSAIDELGLSPEQVAEIRKILQAPGIELARMLKDLAQKRGSMSAEEATAAHQAARAKYDELRKAADEQALQVLTPAQREAAQKYVSGAVRIDYRSVGRGKAVTKVIRKPGEKPPEAAPAPLPEKPAESAP